MIAARHRILGPKRPARHVLCDGDVERPVRVGRVKILVEVAQLPLKVISGRMTGLPAKAAFSSRYCSGLRKWKYSQMSLCSESVGP